MGVDIMCICGFCGGLLDHGEWLHHINKHCSRPQWGETNKRPGLSHVILGGESGPGARPMHPQRARDVRDQCQEAGVPFLFKQWGAWGPTSSGPRQGMMAEYGKKAAGRLLDGREWNELPGGPRG